MNEKPTSILLIDDHPMLRSGVKQLITMTPELSVIAEAGNGEEGLALAEQFDPDLILLDLNMEGMSGLDTLQRLRQKAFSGRIVVFTVSNHEEDVITAIKHGADGYLLKDMEPEDLLKSLCQAATGEMILSKELTPILASGLRDKTHHAHDEYALSDLTARERDILQLLAEGLPNKSIARRLGIAESTVKVHIKSVFKKLKLRSRVEAALWMAQKNVR
jgi:Response regulator containing a CheY-like receiver domain and an HTH DNA-binding domain